MERVIEKIMDAGFDPEIQDQMDCDDYQRVVENALGGDPGARTVYVEKFFEVIRNLDETLYKNLIRKVIRHGPERGVEEFLEEVSDRVILFETEVIDLLQDSPAMPEPVEIEIEDELNTDELVFRFWNPGDGAEPVAEFTCRDPAARPKFMREGIHDVIAAAWIPEMRQIVEETLHDLNPRR